MSNQMVSVGIDEYFLDGEYRKTALLNHLKKEMPKYETYCKMKEIDPTILKELLIIENWKVEDQTSKEDGTIQTTLLNQKFEATGYIFEKDNVAYYLSVQL